MTAKAWVLSATEDADADTVALELLVPPAATYMLAPAGMLDYSRGDAGYEAGGPYIYLREHAFSLAADSYDISWWASGYKGRIVEADPTDPASPLTWTFTASAVTAASHRITLGGTLASFDTAKRYLVYYDDYSTCVTAQEASYAFIADDSDRLILNAVAQRPWCLRMPSGVSAAPDETVGLMRPAAVSDDEGEPLSASLVYSWAAALNNLKARACSQIGMGQFWESEQITVTGTAYKWGVGPYWFHYPPGATTLTISAWIKVTAGTGTIRATASPTMPGGTAYDLTWSGNVSQATATTTSTSFEEVTISLPIWQTVDRTACLTLELKNSGANDTVFLGATAYFESIPI